MATFTRWDDDLADALREPFPVDAHSEKTQGGTKITFVDVHEYKERLNATVGPQGWESAVRMEVVGGKLVCTVRLTILNVTKENVGDEVEVPELNAKGNEKIIGAPCTNSYAQAFKRACSDFGLGAYLYDKEKRDAAAKGRTAAPRNGAVSTPAPAERHATANPWDKRLPIGKKFKGKALIDIPDEDLRSTAAWCLEKDADGFASLVADINATLIHKAGN